MLSLLKDGEHFGESTLIAVATGMIEPVRLEVRAVTDSVLLVLSKEDLELALDSSPRVLQRVKLWALSARAQASPQSV